MWRSNVLRLRKCSSTARSNHGVRIRWYSSEKSLPISELEFEEALSHVLPFRRSTDGKKRPLGFAISGGVDSMALACLYARARQTHVHLPQARGFIVDHKVRPESTEEAEWVAEQLRSKYSMDASVLTLTWPKDLDIAEMKKFETEARKLRYRALGRACRDHGINTLMVAHHGDDQAETVMMRLASNRLRSGLQGMLSTEWIPECEGIYGVHHSGQGYIGRTPSGFPFPVEQGGIRILRPLLAMEKSRLIATCEEQGVEWAEDKSNHIQTLTSRNAIRHIYKNHKLPEALSIKSLADLSLHMQKRIGAHKAYAESLYNKCLLKLDIQEGTLLVRFPPFSKLLARPIVTEADKNEAKNTANYLFERVASLVTPSTDKPTIGQIADRVDDIYPEFILPEEADAVVAAGEGHFKQNFTVHHVWWRKWDKTSPFDDDALPSTDFSASTPHPKEWLLSRQLLAFNESEKLQISIPPSLPGGPEAEYPESMEDYKLFDGRYWIKLRNYTKNTLVLRHFLKDDMKHVPVTQNTKKLFVFRKLGAYFPERFIVAALALVKPSDVRFTLPAVFSIDDKGESRLIGFPTLNVGLGGVGPPQEICDWRVRYKKIDFGQHTPEKVIVPGKERHEVIEEEKRLRYANKGISHLKLRMGRDKDGKKEGWGAPSGFQRVRVNPRLTHRLSERPLLKGKGKDGKAVRDQG